MRLGGRSKVEEILPGGFSLREAAELSLAEGDAAGSLRQSGRSHVGIRLNVPGGFGANVPVASELPVALVVVNAAAECAGLRVVGERGRRVQHRDGFACFAQQGKTVGTLDALRVSFNVRKQLIEPLLDAMDNLVHALGERSNGIAF